MAFVLADRVQETSSTAGTGTLILAGAFADYKTFSTGVGNGNTTFYVAYDSTANVWEVGQGTVGAGTLSRDTVVSNSSNTTAFINFSGNPLTVWCDYPATQAVYKDTSGNVTVAGIIKSSTGGFTFPDNTTQTTAAVSGKIPFFEADGTSYNISLTLSSKIPFFEANGTEVDIPLVS